MLRHLSCLSPTKTPKFPDGGLAIPDGGGLKPPVFVPPRSAAPGPNYSTSHYYSQKRMKRGSIQYCSYLTQKDRLRCPAIAWRARFLRSRPCRKRLQAFCGNVDYDRHICHIFGDISDCRSLTKSLSAISPWPILSSLQVKNA